MSLEDRTLRMLINASVQAAVRDALLCTPDLTADAYACVETAGYTTPTYNWAGPSSGRRRLNHRYNHNIPPHNTTSAAPPQQQRAPEPTIPDSAPYASTQTSNAMGARLSAVETRTAAKPEGILMRGRHLLLRLSSKAVSLPRQRARRIRSRWVRRR